MNVNDETSGAAEEIKVLATAKESQILLVSKVFTVYQEGCIW